MRNVFKSSLQLPSSKSILQTLGTLYRLPHEKTPLCLLTVCCFVRLWATAQGFPRPRTAFLFPTVPYPLPVS